MTMVRRYGKYGVLKRRVSSISARAGLIAERKIAARHGRIILNRNCSDGCLSHADEI
jgi:hypothetical protein